MKSVAVIVDTNVFLHFRPVGEFSWSEIIPGSRVAIVLCAQVIRELDVQKDKASKASFKNRARRALKLAE